MCRTEFLYPTYLASERVQTPDPDRECFFGQQIVVQWHFPKGTTNQPTSLFLTIRYGTREVETLEIPLVEDRGWWIHRLLNDDYWCRGGILSFKAEVFQGENLLANWTHFLWAELIEIAASIEN